VFDEQLRSGAGSCCKTVGDSQMTFKVLLQRLTCLQDSTFGRDSQTRDQSVRHAAHRRDDHHRVLMMSAHNLRHLAKRLRVLHRLAAKLHYCDL